MEGRARNFSRRHPGLRPARVRVSGREGRGFRWGEVRASGGGQNGVHPGGRVRRTGIPLSSAQEPAAGAGTTLRSAGMWWALATDAAVSSREGWVLSAGDVAE